MVLYSLAEYWFVRNQVRQYLLAKALGILTLQIFIVTFFYIYTIFTGNEILILDIISYVAGAAICQVVSYRIMTDQVTFPRGDRIGASVLVIHFILLVVFTFWPPKRGIFADPRSGRFGTTWHVEPEDMQDHEH
jgi:hypothetical protein